MNLVVLAAGRGTRFGGVKQLAEVGAHGETVTDVLLARAAAAGIERAVIVVSPEVEPAMRAHFTARGHPMPVTFALQRERKGTADALLAGRGDVDGWCIVVNADDAYPVSAFSTLVEHVEKGGHEHAMVAFRVARTGAGARPVSRALVGADADGHLTSVIEGRVTADDAGMRFEDTTRSIALNGDELVSMNIWLFHTQFFDELAQAVGAHADTGEVYLPDAVGRAIAHGQVVRVFASEDDCVELTYADDVAAVRAALSP